jgi:phosphoribosylaminoimidazole-succinocarboxamide synthase
MPLGLRSHEKSSWELEHYMSLKERIDAASAEPLLNVDLAGIKKVKSGKVRELFDLGDRLLMVATDRISAFDCIMPNGIPLKGVVLTQISHFWFDLMASLVPNHRLARADEPLPPQLGPYEKQLSRRAMIVKKAQPLPIECVVRGYLAGSGWTEYRRSQSVCGIPLSAGLVESAELPEPIFTPATKAASGHDINISFEQAAQTVGGDTAEQVRRLSLQIYDTARRYARERGIIIADTKFEFGFDAGRLILIDEVLTPDSSRFWPADQYHPGHSQPSFDKQFVRDYLETLNWNKTPPAPKLPEEVVARTRDKYVEAYERLTGKEL